MSDLYNSPRVEEILMEQGHKMPFRPLGFLDIIGREAMDKDRELLDTWSRYLDDEITSSEFRDRAEAIKCYIKQHVPVKNRRQILGVREIDRRL